MNDFDASEFLGLSPEERMKKCRMLSESAAKLAVESPQSTRAIYSDISHQWRLLAQAIEENLRYSGS